MDYILNARLISKEDLKMKKLIFAVLAVALTGIAVFAAGPERKYELTFGPAYTWTENVGIQSFNSINISINMQTLKFSARDDMGAYVGLFMPLSKNFGFYPGLYANWDAAADLVGSTKTRVSYQFYALDLDARYNFQFKAGTFYLMGGPTVTYLRMQSGNWDKKLSANTGFGLSLKTHFDWLRFTVEGKYRVNPQTFFGDAANHRPNSWTAFTGLTLKF